MYNDAFLVLRMFTKDQSNVQALQRNVGDESMLECRLLLDLLGSVVSNTVTDVKTEVNVWFGFIPNALFTLLGLPGP